MTSTILTYTDNSPTRVDRFIKTVYPTIPYSVIQKWVRTGSLRINDKRVTAGQRLNQGDILKVPPFKVDMPMAKEPLKKIIPQGMLEEARSWLVYEDEEILAFNKPAGMAVQGGTDVIVSMDILVRQAFKNSAIRVVHRLDKETSGLLVMAKDRASAQKLSYAFQQQEVKKTYIALVVGVPHPSQGRIQNYLSKRGDNFEKMAVISEESQGQGDWAVTDYHLMKKNQAKGLSLLRLYPQTGRMHQLRVHLAHIGVPILGDGKYGGSQAHPFSDRTPLGLHAESIHFPWGLELSVPWPLWFQSFTGKLA